MPSRVGNTVGHGRDIISTIRPYIISRDRQLKFGLGMLRGASGVFQDSVIHERVEEALTVKQPTVEFLTLT